MNYETIRTILECAEETGAQEVTVEIDAGTATVPLSEALQAWEELAPGEPFQILAVRYGE